MRVLFLDKYCPGHFRHLSRFMVSEPGYESMFFSEYRRKDFDLPGQVSVKVGRGSGRLNPAEALQQMSRRAEAFAEALKKLKSKGYTPDVICLGAASGCGLYVSDVFPDVPVLGVFDYFHQPGEHEGDSASLRLSNLFQLDAVQKCAKAIIGGEWQKESFPKPWRESLSVLPEGVDTDYFCPGPKDSRLDGAGAVNLITYISRTLSMESGFPDFYRALPKVLKESRSHVIIVGYPEKHGSDGGAFEKLIASTPVDRERVRFVNFCTAEQYLAILRSTSLHVFLSGPLVFSTGLLEALSCGCLVVTSDTGPVREILQKGGQALLTPAVNADALAATMLQALHENEKFTPLRLLSRQAMTQHFNAKNLLTRRIALLHEICGIK